MLTLRPLLVVTGSLHVEGGEEWETTRQATKDARVTLDGVRSSGERVKTVIDRSVSKDRRKGNVIYLDFYRRLRKIQLCRTPFGALIDPAHKADLLAILDLMDQKIVEFNKASTTCQLTNCVVWDKLAGNRQAGVAGWVARRARKDAEWRDLARQLGEDAAA